AGPDLEVAQLHALPGLGAREDAAGDVPERGVGLLVDELVDAVPAERLALRGVRPGRGHGSSCGMSDGDYGGTVARRARVLGRRSGTWPLVTPEWRDTRFFVLDATAHRALPSMLRESQGDSRPDQADARARDRLTGGRMDTTQLLKGVLDVAVLAV